MTRRSLNISTPRAASLLILSVFISIIASTRSSANNEWYEYFFQAERALKEKDYESCAARMEIAFDRNSKSGTYIVEGNIVEYYPHSMMCECYSKMQDKEKARCHCAVGSSDEKYEACRCEDDTENGKSKNRAPQTKFDPMNPENYILKKKISDTETESRVEDYVTTTYSGGVYEVPLTIDRTRATSSGLRSDAGKPSAPAGEEESQSEGIGRFNITMKADSENKGKQYNPGKRYARKDVETTRQTEAPERTDLSQYSSSPAISGSERDARETDYVDTSYTTSLERERHLKESREAVERATGIRRGMSEEQEQTSKKRKINQIGEAIGEALVIYGAYKLDQKLEKNAERKEQLAKEAEARMKEREKKNPEEMSEADRANAPSIYEFYEELPNVYEIKKLSSMYGATIYYSIHSAERIDKIYLNGKLICAYGDNYVIPTCRRSGSHTVAVDYDKKVTIKVVSDNRLTAEQTITITKLISKQDAYNMSKQ